MSFSLPSQPNSSSKIPALPLTRTLRKHLKYIHLLIPHHKPTGLRLGLESIIEMKKFKVWEVSQLAQSYIIKSSRDRMGRNLVKAS